MGIRKRNNDKIRGTADLIRRSSRYTRRTSWVIRTEISWRCGVHSTGSELDVDGSRIWGESSGGCLETIL